MGRYQQKNVWLFVHVLNIACRPVFEFQNLQNFVHGDISGSIPHYLMKAILSYAIPLLSIAISLALHRDAMVCDFPNLANKGQACENEHFHKWIGIPQYACSCLYRADSNRGYRGALQRAVGFLGSSIITNYGLSIWVAAIFATVAISNGLFINIFIPIVAPFCFACLTRLLRRPKWVAVQQENHQPDPPDDDPQCKSDISHWRPEKAR